MSWYSLPFNFGIGSLVQNVTFERPKSQFFFFCEHSRKFMQSTFPSTMADSMSGDELSLHLGRQVALQNEKYKEPEPAVEEVSNNYN